MSNCIRKQRKSLSIFKRTFLLKVIARFKEMLIYKNCFKCSFHFCTVSPLDSMRYIECIRLNRSRYDVLSPTVIQLETLSSIYIYLETELEDIFEKQMQKSLYIV